jgi:hypothetical protein
MAYTLPVDIVPALGACLWPATFLILRVFTNVYFRRAGFATRWQERSLVSTDTRTHHATTDAAVVLTTTTVVT